MICISRTIGPISLECKRNGRRVIAARTPKHLQPLGFTAFNTFVSHKERYHSLSVSTCKGGRPYSCPAEVDGATFREYQVDLLLEM